LCTSFGTGVLTGPYFYRDKEVVGVLCAFFRDATSRKAIWNYEEGLVSVEYSFRKKNIFNQN
jgi:hypothetical protein